MNELKPFFRRLLDLREGAEEKAIIIENVKDDADFSSARFWTLVFAIGVASVGLNINSIPVIIGAMLISPLMGPIVSLGLSLSINDWGLMRRSFRNLIMLTVISIGISTLYFALTPITNAQSELLSRIQPTIFDVMIAIFGGLAGFIGVSRAKHTNIIPGVAIATALMPPLCTVGYGIATWQPKFVFGAFYLFLINSIFICISALVVATYLKLPKKEYSDEIKKRRVNRIISTIIFIIVAPAIFLAFTYVGQNNFNQNVDNFIKATFEDRGHVIVYKRLSYTASPKEVELAFLDEHFSEEQLNEFDARLVDFDLDNVDLQVRQNGFSLTEEEWLDVLNEVKSDDSKVLALEARLESEKLSFRSPEKILAEAQAINSKVINIAIGSLDYGTSTDDVSSEPMVSLVYTLKDVKPLTINETEAISNWLKARLKQDDIITYFIPPPEAGSTTAKIAY